MIIALAILILIICIVAVAVPKVGTVKQVILTETELAEYELTISNAEMPLHNTIVFSESGLKDKLNDAMWTVKQSSRREL